MALRNLVLEGDPLLRKTSRPVEEITPRIIKLLDDMADTMYFEGRGIGIAAPQVGVLRRVFIVDVGDEHGLIEFINPEILEASGSQTDNEGCLSVMSTALLSSSILRFLKPPAHRQITKDVFLFPARHAKSRDLRMSRLRLLTVTATSLNSKLMTFLPDASVMRTIT